VIPLEIKTSHNLSPRALQQLLQVAREVVVHVVQGKNVRLADEFVKNMEPTLREAGASFVTLKKAGQLRGCMGSLEAQRPLVEDVAHNAVASALQDPRFARVQPGELPTLDISVAVLTKPEAFSVGSQNELISTLRPNVDGLILQEGRHRATYLPSVWEQLPDPNVFVRELKRKAGLPENYWSPSIQLWRYQTITQSGKLLPN
jgi:AmmeMemoRadiSam system protein A